MGSAKFQLLEPRLDINPWVLVIEDELSMADIQIPGPSASFFVEYASGFRAAQTRLYSSD